MSSQDRPSLAEALSFTEEEIAANRSGRLSEAQRERMKSSRSRGRAGTVVMGVVVVAFIAVIAIVLLPKLSIQTGPGSSTSVVAAIGALAFILVVMSISIRRTRRSLDKLVPAQVERIEGVTTTREHQIRGNVGDPSSGMIGYGGGVRYEVTIGNVRFFVRSKAVLDAFDDGRNYRGYYVGKWIMATLLSAEPSPEAS